VRVGITVPQFRGAPADALAAARAADESGVIDGVFVFDHLWAINQPDRPALSCWPLLGAFAQATERVTLGTLVARVSLLPDAVLAHHVATMLDAVGTPDRFIAGLGAGDVLSQSENEAYGIPFPPVGERLARLLDCTRRCKAEGATVWVGGLGKNIRAIAREERVALNVWGVNAHRVATEAEQGETTWGGVLADVRETPEQLLRELEEAGATWAVIAPPYKANQPPNAAIKVIEDAIART
jgi:alkanesulfonate monooxygenase SsuD/methylene tetrahydromethanopterin reductase-like flavin-dependent oxidoreductase (luciferase family)